MSEKLYTKKQMGDAGEMLVAAELTLHGIPALKVPTIGRTTTSLPTRQMIGPATALILDGCKQFRSRHAPSRRTTSSNTTTTTKPTGSL